MAVYLVRWGKYSAKVAGIYAAAGYVILVAFYDRTLHLFWQPTWLGDWLPGVLPVWFPTWLLF